MFIAVVFTVVSVHHHHAALFTIFPLPVAPPCHVLESLPRFGYGKFCLCAKGKVSRKEKKARCQSIQNKKRQGANILNKKEKEGKEKPHHTRQQNYIWGAGLFPCWAPPPFPVLGFGAIFFLISDCQVLERRIPAVVSHPDLGAGLPLWTGTHQGASPLGRHHLCCLCTFTLVSSNIATCLALLFNLALLFDCANPCN